MNSLCHLLLLLLEFHRLMLAILSNDGLGNLDIAQQTPVVDNVLDGGVLAQMDADTLQVFARELVGQHTVGLFPMAGVAAGALDLEAQEMLREHLAGNPSGEEDGVLPHRAGILLAIEEPRQHTGTEAISVPATWTTN